MKNQLGFPAANFKRLVCSIAVLLPLAVFAQGHFIFKANTEDYYVIVVQSAALNNMPLEPGDEIGVFTPAGLCVGATVVQSTNDTALTAWQDDSITPAIDGYRDGEAIAFRVWDVSNQSEFVMNAHFMRGNGNFGDGPYAQVDLNLQVNFAPRTSFAEKYSFEEDGIFLLNLNAHVFDENHAVATLAWTLAGGQNITGTLRSGNLAQFTAAADWFGAEVFTFTVADPLGARDTALVTIEVLAVNDLPALQLPASLTITEDDSSQILTLDDFVSDVDNSDAQISWQITASANVGARYNPATRTVRVLPKRDFFGTTSWQLQATDANGGVSSGTLSINVTPVQDRPGAATLASPIGGAPVDSLNVTLQWQASYDPDGDALNYLVLYGTARTLTSQVDSGRTTDTFFRIPNTLAPNRRYYWRVVTYDGFTAGVPSAIDSFVTSPGTAVAEPAEIPLQFGLEQNYPNPFSLGKSGNATLIRFSLPQPAFVALNIHNALGQKIASVTQRHMPAGKHEAAWNGATDSGQRISSGIYWIHFTAGKFQALRKIMVVK